MFLRYLPVILVLGPHAVFGAEEPGVPTEKTERIEVTGSHIRRLDTEGVAAVTTVTRKEIDKSGKDSVADVLRDTGVNSFGSAREQSGTNASGNAEISLRGLGSDNTLVLLNGQRLPTDAITGAVDLNLIPLVAVERIEILKDGASAIYGSDALGGVVNIITRKDFSGTQAGITQTFADQKGGAQTNLSIVNGVNAEKLNIVSSFSYRYNQGINSRDRKWSDHGFSKIGDPGSYRNAGGKWKADPNCPADQVLHTPSGDYCQFKYSNYSSELPSISQFGGLSEANYEVSSRVKLTARIGATHRQAKWSFAPAPGTFTIPGSVANTLGAGGGQLPGTTAGQDVDVQYRLTDLGTRDSVNTQDSYNILLGSNIQLPKDWTMNVNLSNSKIHGTDKGVNGYALTDALESAVTSGAYNPFGTAGNKGSLASAKYQPLETTTSRLAGAEVSASGEILETASGPIGLAVGTSFNYQSYKDVFDAQSVAGNVFGNAGSSGGGQRTTQAIYSELSIPLFSKSLELQAAGRYDRYSDFGSTINPKAGLIYHASPSLLIRGSAGTGFRAPLMQELYAASSDSFESFIDAVACAQEKAAGGTTPSCKAQQYEVKSKGNTGLKQETSVAYNLGAVFEPSKKFNLSTDFFITKINNVPGIDYGDMTIAEASGANTRANGVTVNRDPQGYIVDVDAPLQNLSSRAVAGVDIGTNLRLGTWKLSTDHSQMFYYREEGFPGAGEKNKLGWNGNPSWRNTTSLSHLIADRHDLSLALNTIARQKTLDKTANIRQYTTLDFSYEYKSKSAGTFLVGMKNILGNEPPVDSSNPAKPINYKLYDPNVRQFLVGYKKTF